MSDIEKIAVPVGNIPSGLFIVCAQDKESNKIDGFLASWIQQVSFDPLRITLCAKPGRPCSDQIIKGEKFSINVVGDHDKTFLKHFWSGYDPAKNPFDEIEHTITDGFVNILGAKSSIYCNPFEVLTPGDHNLIISDVVGSTLHSDSAKPMTHIRKSGLSY